MVWGSPPRSYYFSIFFCLPPLRLNDRNEHAERVGGVVLARVKRDSSTCASEPPFWARRHGGSETHYHGTTFLSVEKGSLNGDQFGRRPFDVGAHSGRGRWRLLPWTMRVGGRHKTAILFHLCPGHRDRNVVRNLAESAGLRGGIGIQQGWTGLSAAAALC